MILIVDSKHYSNFAALAHHKTGFWSSVYHDQIFFLKEVQ
jgi:hypothetical protein